MSVRPILVVGREELFVEFLQCFSPTRYAVLFAADARGAALLLRSRNPELIITPVRGDPAVVALLKEAQQKGIRVLGLDHELTQHPRVDNIVPPGDSDAVVQAARGMIEGQAGGEAPRGSEAAERLRGRIDRLADTLGELRAEAHAAQESFVQRLEAQQALMRELRQELQQLGGQDPAAPAGPPDLKLEAQADMLGLSPFDDDGPTALQPEQSLWGAEAPRAVAEAPVAEGPAAEEDAHEKETVVADAMAGSVPEAAKVGAGGADENEAETRVAGLPVADPSLKPEDLAWRPEPLAEVELADPPSMVVEAPAMTEAGDEPSGAEPLSVTLEPPAMTEAGEEPSGVEPPAAGPQVADPPTDLYAPPEPIVPVAEPALDETDGTSPARARPRMWPFHVAVAVGVVALTVLAIVVYQRSSRSDEKQPPATEGKVSGKVRLDAMAVSPPPASDAAAPPDAVVPDQRVSPDLAVAREIPLMQRPGMSRWQRQRLSHKLDLLVHHARYLLKRKRISPARVALLKASRIKDDYRVSMLLARAHRMGGELHAAAQQLGRAVDLAPGRRSAYLSHKLGLLYLEIGDSTKACDAFRAAAVGRRPSRKAVRALKKHCK